MLHAFIVLYSSVPVWEYYITKTALCHQQDMFYYPGGVGALLVDAYLRYVEMCSYTALFYQSTLFIPTKKHSLSHWNSVLYCHLSISINQHASRDERFQSICNKSMFGVVDRPSSCVYKTVPCGAWGQTDCAVHPPPCQYEPNIKSTA